MEKKIVRKKKSQKKSKKKKMRIWIGLMKIVKKCSPTESKKKK